MITLNHDRVKHANLARNAASAPVNCNLNFPAESASIYLFVSVHRRARLGALRFANRPPTVCTTKSPAEIVTSVSWVVEGHGPWPLTTIPNQSSSKEPQTKFSVSNASNWKRSCYPLCNCGYCLRFVNLAVRLLRCNYPRATEGISFGLSVSPSVFLCLLMCLTPPRGFITEKTKPHTIWKPMMSSISLCIRFARTNAFVKNGV